MELNKELLINETDGYEADALILAAMDMYRYDVDEVNSVITIDVPVGKFIVTNKTIEISEDALDLFKKVDLDSYRESVAKLANQLKLNIS